MTSETHVALGQLLSHRQREILELLRFGLTDIEIAERLDISVSGVRYHVTEIINKLGVENRYEAADWPQSPPWWATAMAPVALFWKKASLVLPVKASSVAAALSVGSLAAAVGGLSLMGFLLGRPNTDIAATAIEPERAAVVSTSVEPSTREVSTGDVRISSSSLEPVAWVAPDVAPEPPRVALATSAQPAASAQPATSAASDEPAVTNTLAPSACSDDTCSAATPTPVPTPLPYDPGPYHPGGRMAVDCDAGEAGIQSSCAFTGGSTFHIQVHITQAPSEGYVIFQSSLSWNDAQLGYLPAAPREQALWEECTLPKSVPTLEEPSLIFSCLKVPADEVATTTGAVVQFQFQCEEDGVTPLDLVEDEGDQLGTYFRASGMAAYPSGPLLAGAQVACGGRGGEPCPPDCPAPSPTPAAPTPTPPPPMVPTPIAPTPTAPIPTPSPREPGAMAVDCAAASAGIQSSCQYPSGASFSIQVHVTQAPSGGYIGFHTKLAWSVEQLDYLPASQAVDSALWHLCDIPMLLDGQLVDQASLAFGCMHLQAPGEGDTSTGAILEFLFQCQEDGLTTLALLPVAGDPNGGTFFLDGFLHPIEPALAAASIQCG